MTNASVSASICSDNESLEILISLSPNNNECGFVTVTGQTQARSRGLSDSTHFSPCLLPPPPSLFVLYIYFWFTNHAPESRLLASNLIRPNVFK